MFDELDMLGAEESLQRLLGDYAEVGAEDRDAWQDRLMELESVEARDLVRLHGLLIGFCWLEQNTGNTAVVRPGAVPCCYRVTPAGIRAARAAHFDAADGDSGATAGVAGRRHGNDRVEDIVPSRLEGRRARPAKAKRAATEKTEAAASESVASLV